MYASSGSTGRVQEFQPPITRKSQEKSGVASIAKKGYEELPNNI